MGEDLYSLLGVARDASTAEIKSSYKRLAKRLHPDVHMSKPEAERAAAERAFKAAKEAYEVLSDERKRMAYDRSGRAGLAGGFGGGGPGPAYARGGGYQYQRPLSVFEVVFGPVLRGFSVADARAHFGMAAAAILGFAVFGGIAEQTWRANNGAKLFDESEAKRLAEVRRRRRRDAAVEEARQIQARQPAVTDRCSRAAEAEA